MSKPSVLFVCVKNGGKSQMAAGLMRKAAGDQVDVYSAGTKPGDAVNALSAETLLEVGVDISGETPTLIDPQLVRNIMADGCDRARKLAQETMRDVREVMGLSYD